MPTPNYTSYTLNELCDALAHIDQAIYPERTAQIKQEITFRQTQETESETLVEVDFQENLHPNWLIRYWRGQVSLVVSYWIIGIAVNALIAILSLIAKGGVESSSTSFQLGTYILALYCSMLIVITWQSVGLFRSASKHPLRGGSIGWAYVAKIMLFIGLISFASQMYTSGYPIMKGAYQSLVDSSTYPPTKFRVLNNGTELELMGGLEVGSETLLEEQLKLNPNIKLLHLHSSGGRVLAAKRMMQVVRRYNLDTYVRTACASSCTLLFLAGNNKLLAQDAKLQFHSASAGGVSGHNIDVIKQELAQEYIDQGLPKWFVDKAVNTPSETFWVPTNDELLKAGVVDSFVNPDLYAYSGFGEESAILREDIDKGLLSKEYLIAMKTYDREAYNMALNINFEGMIKGLPKSEIVRQFVSLVYELRLPNYLAKGSDVALVKYWKAQIFRMRELKDNYPLACAAFIYPEEVPSEYHLASNGEISEQAQEIEYAALAELIRSTNGTYLNLDEETQQTLIVDVVGRVREKNEEYYQVVASAKDFVGKPDIMCGASIALSEAFISFNVETSGQLLRSIHN